ncbi:NAD-glutamate dehydrogenase [Angustibacter sp. Root456]|uniref:NAD-glutamate dehydrogenase n=1 Tax=Angustibacter sp. Root456 TaxID=1736539 RepID=UPI000700DAC9|nr:NAD-glutamate dehydrogenase [Angustibacter sp. Root456]KQX65644.1 NAD-glutamate dehydrogenase [Angustibacter sp. Root456]
MAHSPAGSRSQLLEKASALAERSQQDATASYLARYYRHVSDDDLDARRPEDLLGAAASQYELARERPVGTANVHVFTPTVDEHGWSSGHTVVEIVTDDMPFLVDSVTAELSRVGRAIHLVVHPVLTVRRDAAGHLQEIVDGVGPTDDLPYDCSRESWMHLEIDRETDQADLGQLTADLRRVLEDVRDAVEDWPKMRDAAQRLAAELADTPPAGVDSAEVAEARRLLSWLADDNFTFIGYREYLLDEDEAGEEVLRAQSGTGLGILRYDQKVSGSFGRMSHEVRARAREPRVLILTKANSRSTVHRPAYLDYVGVKNFDADGQVIGERRFLGLFTSAAYTESVTRIPVIDTKVQELLRRTGFAMESHSGKDLLEILETYPRDELFQIGVDDLYAITTSVLHLQERRRTRLFLRRDDYGRFMSCLVYLPRDRYTTHMRLRMEEILREAFHGETVDYTTRVSESVLARLHYVVRVPDGEHIPDVDVEELESRLVEATRTWDEDFAESLRADVGEEEAARLLAKFGKSFPEAYKEDFPARVAVADLRHVCAVTEGPATGADAPDEARMNLYQEPGRPADERRFKFYRAEPLSLTRVLPVFSHLGVEVVDERPYELDLPDGGMVHVYDFGLRYGGGEGWDRDQAESARAAFQEAFAAVWSGRAESDGFNALVLGAGLTWRQASVLRAYTKYLRQAGLTFSQEYVEACLLSNVDIARLLVRLFEARFDPDHFGGAADADARRETCDALVEEITGALDDVASLDQDRILRALLGVVRATLRTSYFQVDADGHPRSYLAFKLDPHAVPDLPEPRPAFEMWVYSPRVEGVHLRFGAVARGGLRWSDRREDFRTEILGLVKAQMVKNAVIVPTGAKGGFVPKQLPDSSDREAWLAEGKAAYRTFISALLDVTDNIVGTGEAASVVPPQRVVRHDGDDTYLVVAADKGTATFSDIANSVAIDYGFWLGDAFASGGSAGYDHKAMGITARGAWESVKRHFRELGLDTQSEDFTVVGVGDMSGDVFGNGMLLSEHIRLVAAFDHRHVFIDPTPDAATSFAERRRLFDLPRSSWEDYDRSLISEGGGVWPRSAKSIPVSSQAAAALGIGQKATSMTPAELMKAILSAPVDLLWNGGIGTYVKASGETSADVGDRANDAIRINGNDLRVRVVGEGGNLGLTQLGRIEAARHGVRINTDAIDNSAGVDTSDHEVNLKILLNAVVADGDLTTKQRNALLADMTDDVAELVLRDNYEQNVLLGNAREQAHAMLPVHARLIRSLVKRGELNREIEFLPSDAEIARRQDEGLGLTSPEFSVLVAYSKITLADDLLASSLPDDPWFAATLRSYFPPQVVERYGDRLNQHPLRREIVTTSLVNNMVNRGGITFAFRVQEETAASTVQVAQAYVVAREVFRLHDFVARVEELDNRVPTRAQTALYLEFRRLMDRAVRWLLQTRPTITDIGAEIERFSVVVDALRPNVPELLVGAEQRRLQRRTKELTDLGVPDDLAVDCASLLDVYSLLDIAEIGYETETPVDRVAPMYFMLSERFQVDTMLGLITRLPRDDRWDALARAALRYDLYAALEQLTVSVLTTSDDGLDTEKRIAEWERSNRATLDRVRDMVGEVSHLDRTGIAALSVALRGLRGVVRSNSASA